MIVSTAVLEDEAILRVLRQGLTVFTTDRPDRALCLRKTHETTAG